LTVADALITGALLPSKLWEVVTSYFPPILQPGASVDDQARNKKSADIQSESLGTAEPKEAVREQKEYYDSSSRNVLTEPDLENEQSYHFDSDKQVSDDQSTGQVAAVRSETDNKGDVEAGVNVTSGDEGAAYMLLRTLSAPSMDATKAIIKRNSTIPILQGSAQPHLLLVDDSNINLKMLGMFVSKCGIPMAQSTSVSGGREAIEAFKVF
jgi:CheY-like chemotaxis protein